ncbi:MAG: hypothetical protein ACD_49C00083G0009 [uncultured bacterium (gcode 4)]|uniref:Uncharacterized protein n=1 Tax=uncultured bacterium (gcode 4) TaxID=1234023 RepID=K2AVC3_9BACT|nr:MAG: hypothetical protein ACD_49C00083G0009 [uncultured bacterium (gcode 4)]
MALKKESTKKNNERDFVFIKDKELDDRTIFKLIEMVLNSKIKGNMISVLIWILLFLSLIFLLIHIFLNR